MNAGGFDRLLYTDCRAGTGRGAGGGFQVQAQSAGVDAAQAKMAVGWLLYDAPSSWIAQRRPVEDFPGGFAHAAEAGYGTAQSRYVGTEATGARPGNHLADCLLTRDLDLYGPIRPAQLWRSPLWRAEAWDTSDCPQLDDTPPLGPLTVDAVAQWLRSRPERPPALARLLSVLEDPSGRRVMITSAEPDEALMWITAATLLLPVRAALDVSFKVFCSNPQRASHRIIAVPKELNPQVVPGQTGSAFVLDADLATSDQAEITERARFWVGRFATVPDPYDVVDAVERAAALGAGVGPGAADAMITAWALTTLDDPPDDPEALFRWLTQADPKLQLEHGSEVVSRIMAAGAPAAMLRWIDAAAAEGRVDADRSEVRARLLTAEIAEVRGGAAPPDTALARTDADPSALRDADSELSSAILLSSDAEVDRLLRLAWRHGVEPAVSPLRARLSALAVGWVDHPRRDYRPTPSAAYEAVLDLVHDELQDRLAKGGTEESSDALNRLWRHLAHRPSDLSDPLDCYIQLAAIRAQPAQERLAGLKTLLRQASASPRAGEDFASLQRGLVEGRALGPAEALAILQVLPDSVAIAPQVIDLAVDEIERTAARPAASALDALGVLSRRGIAPRGRLFAELLEADRAVLGFIQATRSARFQADQPWGRRWVKQLGEAEPAVIRARLGHVLAACLEFPLPELGAGVLSVLPPRLQLRFIDLWAGELKRAHGIGAAVWGVHWADFQQLDKLRPDIAAAFQEFGSALGPEHEERWYGQVLAQLKPEMADTWVKLAGREARSRRGRRFRGRQA